MRKRNEQRPSAPPFLGWLLAMEGGDLADITDDALKYETYEQYLDSQVRLL